MSHIDLQLPTLQNWNCHNCSGCCRQHGIFITDEERRRIESQNWTAAEGVPEDQPLFVKTGGRTSSARYRLAHQPDGACVFLDGNGLCRIHGKFGEEAKPLACRIYPYAFHPAGNKITVSLRFSCPSVAANRGTGVAAQKKEIRRIAEQVVPQGYREIPPPKITAGDRLDWPDTLRIVQRLDETFADEGAGVVVKLLRALFWIDLIGQTRFEHIRGERLDELLDLLTEAARVELPASDDAPDGTRFQAVQEGDEADSSSGRTAVRRVSGDGLKTAPTKVGMSQFRLLAGQYARKDTFASTGQGLAGRWRMLKSALRLTSGSGLLPALNDGLKEVPFAALEESFGGIPEESEEMLTRYFRVKVQGLHFCGRAYYDVPLVEGLQSLVLVFPAVVWIARWRGVSAGRNRLTHEDVLEALTLVDHQHGYSDALGTWSSRRRVRNLVRTGDLPTLVEWLGQ